MHEPGATALQFEGIAVSQGLSELWFLVFSAKVIASKLEPDTLKASPAEADQISAFSFALENLLQQAQDKIGVLEQACRTV